MRVYEKADDSAYRDYRSEIEGDRLIRSLRVGCGVVAVLSTAFIPLDFAAFKDNFAPMLIFRLFCNAVMLAIILRTARTNPLSSAVVGCLTTGAMLLTVIQSAGGVASAYTPGLMLLFLGMPVLLPLTAFQAGFIVLTLIVALGALPTVTGVVIDIKTYSLHIMFPVAAGIESIAASALLDRMRFADFLGRREIETARDDLKALDREKSRFTANVHHELRTPLTLMLAPTNAMIDGEFGPISELQRSYLETIKSNGQRLQRLINDLLDLAKIEGAKYRIFRRKIDVWGVIRGYAENARPLAETKAISLTVSNTDDVAPIFVDPDALERIISNLLGNALKFTRTGGAIAITLRSDGEDGVHLEVADTGIGLAVDQLERIFDRFAQADSSSTRQYEGTGIGLALVKELVELHSGSVWADSEGLDCGTQMHVLLPVGLEDVQMRDESTPPTLTLEQRSGEVRPSQSGTPHPQEAAPDARRCAQSLGRGSSVVDNALVRGVNHEAAGEAPADAPEVLIVEDNDDMRRLLTFLLRKEFRIRAATNGREGLEKVKERIPDLVMTDVMMPEMTGIELCDALKSAPETKMVPVILVTSKAESEMKIKGLELGADDYITKPFHPAELLARARSVVRIRLLQKQLWIKNARLESANEELEQTLLELKNASAALVQSERLAAVGELAAGIAHEVNNPVNFASNALKAILEYTSDVREIASAIADADWFGRDNQERAALEVQRLIRELRFQEVADALTELTEIASEGLDRTRRLVGDLRDFAAPNESAPVEVNVSKCVESTLQLIGYSIRENGVNVHLEIADRSITTMGSSRALSQVILNLIKNANEAVEKGVGEIQISLRREGKYAVVEVKDDGPGIREEDLEVLFEPFFSTKAAGEGTGLGLSICQRIVSEMNGVMSVESRIGMGSTFIVRVPEVRCETEGRDATEA